MFLILASPARALTGSGNVPPHNIQPTVNRINQFQHGSITSGEPAFFSVPVPTLASKHHVQLQQQQQHHNNHPQQQIRLQQQQQQHHHPHQH